MKARKLIAVVLAALLVMGLLPAAVAEEAPVQPVLEARVKDGLCSVLLFFHE